MVVILHVRPHTYVVRFFYGKSLFPSQPVFKKGSVDFNTRYGQTKIYGTISNNKETL